MASAANETFGSSSSMMLCYCVSVQEQPHCHYQPLPMPVPIRFPTSKARQSTVPLGRESHRKSVHETCIGSSRLKVGQSTRNQNLANWCRKKREFKPSYMYVNLLIGTSVSKDGELNKPVVILWVQVTSLRRILVVWNQTTLTGRVK